MEKTLNMGAFEALDHQEMMEVDGGCKECKAAGLNLFGRILHDLGLLTIAY